MARVEVCSLMSTGGRVCAAGENGKAHTNISHAMNVRHVRLRRHTLVRTASTQAAIAFSSVHGRP